MDDFQLFELAFQRFIEGGGFAQSCISQDIELQYREVAALPKPVACPHGGSYLSCSRCYFENRKQP